MDEYRSKGYWPLSMYCLVLQRAATAIVRDPWYLSHKHLASPYAFQSYDSEISDTYESGYCRE